ncbi:MAG: hypothetical protein QNI94_03425 [Kiloniellales bacterium]|nr:hypothetical protein [Kiloniellales bacterium]
MLSKSWVLWLCLLAGLALGPGYFVYAGFFVGAVVADPDWRFAEAGAGLDTEATPRVLTLRLDPGMNPIAAVVKLQALENLSGTQTRATEVALTLSRGGAPLWTEAASFTQPRVAQDRDASLDPSAAVKRDTFRTLVKRFEVEAADDYTLTLAFGARNELQVIALGLELRRNARPPDLAILSLGGMLLTISLVGLWLARRQRRARGA